MKLCRVIWLSLMVAMGAAVAQAENAGCRTDADCVPQQCCHATACVAKAAAPDCSAAICTADCRPNTIDCGGGCFCQAGVCQAKLTGTGQPPTAKRCGGVAGVKCGSGEYCEFEPQTCRVADREGVCAEMPKNCTMDFTPVCGCDGNTYGNACQAAMKGQSIEAQGECPK